jgi:DNA-binding response OmpR family regulator
LECGGPAPLFKLLDQSQLFVIKKRRRAVGLGAAELGIEPEILDTQSHELVLDGQRVKLTKLEFEVFRYLYTRKGTAVSRASLVEDVWGWKHTGSNVIEAVMRTLRKKLGDKSESIETIRGLGYRFRNI